MGNSLKKLVGAGRFERPTPCTQGTGIGSKGSMAFHRILIKTIIWGICSSLDSQPKRPQQMEFGHSYVTDVQKLSNVSNASLSDVDTALFCENPEGPIPIHWRRYQLFGKFMGIAPLKCLPQSIGSKGGIERTRRDEQVQVNQITNPAIGGGAWNRVRMNLLRELLLAGNHGDRRR
jgi:hypothetical protein